MRAMASYGEYCPIAAGAEVFGDRWTPLVLRELILGSTRFNDIHRGVPKMSRTLLSQRLRALVRRELVERVGTGYHLTDAGRGLEPLVWELGRWAARWSFGDPADEDLDAEWIVWRLHQRVLPRRIPGRRTTIEFDLRGPGGGRAWLVLDRRESTACWIDPGYDVDLLVRGANREVHRWLLRQVSLDDALAAGHMELVGPPALVDAFPKWFGGTPMDAALDAGMLARATTLQPA